MGSIAVITDTDASLPLEIVEALGIRLVPINIHFGEETFRSGVDIDDATLFARVDRDGTMPTTSAPSPGEFAKAYEAAFQDGHDAVVCICVSSVVSGTYNAAVTARGMFPDRTIHVVDSRNISMGQGFMTMVAAEAASQGADVESIVARAQEVGRRTSLYAALDTLHYLALSGRVGYLAAGMASVLKIKPVLTMDREGKLDLLEKVRTRKKAWSRVVDLIVESLGDAAVERAAILHVDALDQAHKFGEQLQAALNNPVELIYADFGPGLSVHTGPGMVGAVVVAAAS